jgi:hypothetical protein
MGYMHKLNMSWFQLHRCRSGALFLQSACDMSESLGALTTGRYASQILDWHCTAGNFLFVRFVLLTLP